MTRTVVVDDDDDTRQTGNGYGNSTAAVAAEWSFRASLQYFRSQPINRLYWTSYDIIYYIIMLLCAMYSDSGAARALFIIAVVVVAYTMSVLIELVNRARRKLHVHTHIYIYRHCTYLYGAHWNRIIILYTHSPCSRIAYYNNSIIIVILWRCHLSACVSPIVLSAPAAA